MSSFEGFNSSLTLKWSDYEVKGVYFALRSGEEHRSLKVIQLQLFEPPGERPYIYYTENVAKNNHGGFA